MKIKSIKQKNLIIVLIAIFLVLLGIGLYLHFVIPYEFNNSVNKQIQATVGSSQYTLNVASQNNLNPTPLNSNASSCGFVKDWLDIWHHSCGKYFNIAFKSPQINLKENLEKKGWINEDGWYRNQNQNYAKCLIQITPDQSSYYVWCFSNAF